MASIIARSIIGMRVAAVVVLFGIGAIGSAAAQPSALRLAAPDGLTNRYAPAVSETDIQRADHHYVGWTERSPTRR